MQQIESSQERKCQRGRVLWDDTQGRMVEAAAGEAGMPGGRGRLCAPGHAGLREREQEMDD